MADVHQAEAVLDTTDDEATRILIAYISNPNTKLEPTQLSQVILDVYRAVEERHQAAPPVEVGPKPAVPVEHSIHHDYLVCLEDGAKLKMLKRYLRAQYNMSPEEYRAKWRLGADYPMVAPVYAEQRSQLAKAQGLGRRAETHHKKTRPRAKRVAQP